MPVKSVHVVRFPGMFVPVLLPFDILWFRPPCYWFLSLKEWEKHTMELVEFFLSIAFQSIIVLYTFTINTFRWWAKLWKDSWGNKIKLLNCTNVVILQMGLKNALNSFLQISDYLFCRLNDFEKKCWSCTC